MRSSRSAAACSWPGSWGEGIAQPTFFDLYGFFPGSYVGNPDLKPERSRGGELSLRAVSGPWRGAVTAYRQHLRDEIVASADFLSAVNASGRSKREGVEVEAGWSGGERLNLSATYAYLDASEPAGRELRRPRHSGSIAADGAVGRLSYGAALSYTGARLDRDFDQFPAPLVRLRVLLARQARGSLTVSRRRSSCSAGSPTPSTAGSSTSSAIAQKGGASLPASALAQAADAALRVASLNLCTDELLLLLGQPRQIVSVSHLSHSPHETALWRHGARRTGRMTASSKA